MIAQLRSCATPVASALLPRAWQLLIRSTSRLAGLPALRSVPPSAKKLEFRIPISPTTKFFSLVRFFNFALRRLERPQYKNARLLVVVGDHCDLDFVRRENEWSNDFN